MEPFTGTDTTMHTLTLRDGKTFQANTTDSILDCALQANIQLEHSCKNGRCGACKAPAQGKSRVLMDEIGLNEQERQSGHILTCCRAAEGPLTLDIEDLPELAGHPPKLIPCRIEALTPVSADVLNVVLRTPPNNPLKFLAGQHISLISPTGIKRSYSLANAPRADHKLELHIKRVEGGAFSQYWFEQAKVNDLLRLNGPLGTFFLRTPKPHIQHLVLLATGTGMAPIKAMMEWIEQQALLGQSIQTIRLYFGGRTAKDLSWSPPEAWQQHPHFNHTACLSREAVAHTTQGYVQTIYAQHIQENNLKLANTAVYACGSNAMIQAARHTLTEFGLPSHQFYADAFVSTE
jgi:CDP-4-dehydro-6-deoxyglucose reductase